VEPVARCRRGSEVGAGSPGHGVSAAEAHSVFGQGRAHGRLAGSWAAWQRLCRPSPRAQHLQGMLWVPCTSCRRVAAGCMHAWVSARSQLSEAPVLTGSNSSMQRHGCWHHALHIGPHGVLPCPARAHQVVPRCREYLRDVSIASLEGNVVPQRARPYFRGDGTGCEQVCPVQHSHMLAAAPDCNSRSQTPLTDCCLERRSNRCLVWTHAAENQEQPGSS
jgi:hypothetical protein